MNPRRILTRALTLAIAALKPPAPESEATAPPQPSPPLVPGQFPRRRPIPRHNNGHLERTADIWACGCVCIWRRSTGRWHVTTCWRHDFDTEWERRLSQP